MTVVLCGTVWILLWTTFFYSELCESTELPESIELINGTNYACYGCNGYFQPSCRNKPNTVIAVQALKVGSKQSNLSCPDVVLSVKESQCSNTTCCKPDVSDDCINVYNYTSSEIDYRFHRDCSGHTICTETIETVWAPTNCPSSTKDYKNYTNYMFMEYSCIKRSMMFDMCKNSTIHSDRETLYLHTPGYPNDMTTQMTSNCTCTLSSSGNMTLTAYLIDVHLVNKTLTVGDSMFNNASGIMYNITNVTIESGGLVTLDTMADPIGVGTKVWIGIKVPTVKGEPFDITCLGPSVDAVLSPSSDGPSGLSALEIALIVAGLLLLLLVFLCCCLYSCFKKKDEIKPRKKMDNKTKDVTNGKPIGNTSKSNPMNTAFTTQRIPKNKVEPTRFIEEHGGLKQSTALLPIHLTPTGLLPSNAGTWRLKPLETKLEQEEISDQIVKKHKKKKKKRRKHKQREAEDKIDDTKNENKDEVTKEETEAEHFDK